jgi:acetylxylan esterase
MRQNVMAATYPEMFAAASVYSGVPAGCFYTGTVDGWNATCAQGHVVASQAYWTSVVKNAYPGYSGSRPAMLIMHGSADTTLYPQNFNETVKEWSGVFGYTYPPPAQTLGNTPSSPYTEYRFNGPNLVAIYGTGVGHTVSNPHHLSVYSY